ncbi:hypothetical protein M514_07864 [Trichuris suis]|uniref:Uncharacterized protein n=1 Tax=Trichuris suis TaxID=68888 RepID=A0A085N330_9BILA|nr:hypothetical protein M513_07864 [Trichuris suis]KFD63876.1 hypothetical protein M514_07864 [Trichuris suis]
MECEVPWFGNATTCELPDAPTIYSGVLGNFKSLFIAKPGRTSLVKHANITEGNPVRVPLRRIPEQLRNTAHQQIQQVLNDAIIRSSQSP